ncbi:LLM class flavin-dependent oxidoreductase [Subtercola endophyticus]|uniref:LLM class flavin-dependent oxidoreductase n=1 Tax=Subtercola endophyticus TaxID=2895559 RepID=UPI001E5DBF8B|nr:LLM class flavin-dependent oxidoreductase [Subtercola endophyticus]UFS57969.1 LLM class flavin-dependent oxidoreductase [Subtercola endophyticus]
MTDAAAQRMILGWFVNYMPTAWNRPWAGSDLTGWTDGEFYVDMARALERASVDLIMLEDSSVVPENFGGTTEAEFKATVKAPKHDPLPLAAAISQATEKLGIVTTMSTSLYPPHRLAQLQSTLDQLSGGRAGWNIVTSFEDLAAQNVGLSSLWEHDERYVRADEYLRLVESFWNGGTSGSGAVSFDGKYFGAQSPAAPTPVQRRPVLCQAGGSSSGMDFAAKWADLIVSVPVGIDAMKAYRDGIRSRLEADGTDPDGCKVLYMVTPILGETDAEAEDKEARMYSPDGDNFLRRLVQLSNISEIDFAQYDLDAPIPEDATTNGAQSILESLKKATRGSSLRAAMAGNGESTSLRLVGSVQSVADQMEAAIGEVGGDGFLLFHGGGGLISRRYLDEVLDGLVPELQRRGLSQTGYGDGTFGERLASANTRAASAKTISASIS